MVKVVAILSPPERAARRKSGEWLVRACAICEHNSRRPRPALRMHAKSSTLDALGAGKRCVIVLHQLTT
ncbi:hypothetical protein OBBRIDRAFT_95641 [Obba rivulosa]|uniref:Uncharacterized protein n=1 Tax=Obba rivulosa TaxID=1052685 RepID=A0A8E2DMQ9_9APHY|nr:hypothetical protein OBBRIDRAFT_95641 [Obba rivulosa]